MTSPRERDAAVLFPFFQLPELVQCKILRQYVPIVTKIHALEKLPEFKNLLEDSWIKLSDDFARLIPILRSLREGLYVPSKDPIPRHGYYVSWSGSGSGVLFTLCCIDERMYEIYPFQVHQFKVSARVSNLCNFLKRFLKDYRPLERNTIFAYRTDSSNVIFVNPLANKLMWCAKIHPIKDNRCIIPNILSPPKYFFYLKKKNVIELQTKEYEYYFFPRSCIYTQTKLEPESLESHLLKDDYKMYRDYNDVLRDNWEGGPLPINRKAGQFEISLKQNEAIAVDVSTANVYVTWRHNNSNLFNILSKDIVQKLNVYR